MTKQILLTCAILSILPLTVSANSNLSNKLSGRILINVEKNGEAWYVNPNNLNRYYLGRPNDAFLIMKELSLGISNDNFNSLKGYASKNLSGKILLKVEDLGKAYYVNPQDLTLHYLGKPLDAFNIMKKLGLGITTNNLEKITQFNPKAVYINHNVPWTSQAPFAEWNNDMFQDGCEEASIIMAMAWVDNKDLTAELAKKQIIDLSLFQSENLNTYHDRSIKDTKDLLITYYKYNNITYQQNVTSTDIINYLTNGSIIIAPMNGQLLNNAYFHPPGPINHMLVITGYDESKNQFITNDPGTKKGHEYRYPLQTLMNALRDYPTGHNEPNNSINKDILVINPK